MRECMVLSIRQCVCTPLIEIIISLKWCINIAKMSIKCQLFVANNAKFYIKMQVAIMLASRLIFYFSPLQNLQMSQYKIESIYF